MIKNWYAMDISENFKTNMIKDKTLFLRVSFIDPNSDGINRKTIQVDIQKDKMKECKKNEFERSEEQKDQVQSK